jgi:uncharacterized BrkB/YihY/UPF0761 family membrane protein
MEAYTGTIQNCDMMKNTHNAAHWSRRRPSARDHLLTYVWALVLIIIFTFIMVIYVAIPMLPQPPLPSSMIITPTSIITTTIQQAQSIIKPIG